VSAIALSVIIFGTAVLTGLLTVLSANFGINTVGPCFLLAITVIAFGCVIADAFAK
jgi:hypothetical protein